MIASFTFSKPVNKAPDFRAIFILSKAFCFIKLSTILIKSSDNFKLRLLILLKIFFSIAFSKDYVFKSHNPSETAGELNAVVLDLNYDNFYNKGNKELETIDQYHSHNTERLDVEGMKTLLKKLTLFGGEY